MLNAFNFGGEMELISLLVLGSILFGAFMFVRGLFMMVRHINISVQKGTPIYGTKRNEMTAEDEGNAHSGPYGYSGATAYPQTQYGSLFNPDAEWAERTGYDRDHDIDPHEQ